jgi:hypothetical protein
VAHTLLGPPPGLEQPEEWTKAREAGIELVWEMDAGRLLENTGGRQQENADGAAPLDVGCAPPGIVGAPPGIGGAPSGIIGDPPGIGRGSAEASTTQAAGSLLPLMEVADVAEMHKNRAVGYSGADRALSSEQELRAARLGDKRMALLTFAPGSGGA